MPRLLEAVAKHPVLAKVKYNIDVFEFGSTHVDVHMYAVCQLQCDSLHCVL